MKIKNKVKIIMLLLVVGALTILKFPASYANSTATFSFSGSSSIETNGSGTIKLVASSPSSGINGLTGTFQIDNPTCVTATVKGANGVNYSSSSGKIVYNDFDEGLKGTNDLLLITLNAGASECSANITVSLRGGLVDNSSFSPTITQEIKVVQAAPKPIVKSNDATLKSLTIDKGTLSPKFSSGTTSYSVEVDSSVTKVVLTATKNHAKATVDGTTTCNLNATGQTACSVKVTAEDGTIKTYTVNVSKKTSQENPPKDDDNPPKEDEPPKEDDPPSETKSSDASLISLNVEGGSLSPTFKSSENYYALSVPNSMTKLTINAIPNNSKATVSISGADNLKVGVNPVKVTVTAEDGTTNVYVINVTREEEKTSNSQGGGTSSSGTNSKSSDNFLKDVIISNGDLSPSFSSTTSSYNVNVPNEVDSLDLKTILSDSKAKVEIRGNENFKVGLNVITIEVTAEDGSLRIYTINVNKSDKNGETKLKDLTVGKGTTLSPTFNPDIYEYNIDVEDLDKLDINAIPVNENSKVEIIGNDNLKDGNNVILVKVTDENGFVQYYRLNVNKTSKKKFLGLSLMQWLGILGAILLLGLLLFIIILLLKRKKKEEPAPQVEKPVIEFKPEINIGSRNGTDDDYVEAGGTLNQFAGALPESANKVIEEATVKEVPYDIYDDIVTKDELFDALQEATKTKDNSKLKMLYAQEMLNRKKEELRKKEEQKEG